MTFGNRIEELRKKNKMNQSELASRLGFTQQTISEYEKGTTKPSLDTFIQLVKELNVTSDYLLLGKVSNSKSQLTKEQKDILKLYDQLSEDKRKLAKSMLKTFKDEENEDRNE